MTRARAIKTYCLDCSGSNKEVSLCHLFDCPLFPYRFGNSPKSRAYKERTRVTLLRYKAEIEELTKMGIDIQKFREV